MPTHLEDAHAGRKAELLAGLRRSRKLHRPWLNLRGTAEAIERFLSAAHDDRRRTIYVIADNDALAGVITVSEIVRGFFQSAYLSYFALAPHHGQGVMTEGLRQVLRLAFGELRLHRVEANIQPANARSIALVKRCGFELEGYSKRYLKMGGRWRDHERWALSKEAWLANAKPGRATSPRKPRRSR
jgi:ribosomal-protein-alanine N-acetyltransferase